MEQELVEGNLVRWLNGSDAIGRVKDAPDDGQQIVVQFDSGEQQTFSGQSDALERLILAKGTRVLIQATQQVGTIANVLPVAGLIAYDVDLGPEGATTAFEDGVRPAVIEDPIELLRAGQLDGTRSTNLRVAATKLAYANEFDELSSLSNSRVEIKPHQVGVVHRVMGSWPHRFILADEVGLGKTIEAGLIIKELKARGLAARVLILAPSGLLSQWHFEMKTKFNETFSLYNGSVVKVQQSDHPNENVWALRDNVIASTGFATWNEEREAEIVHAGWDLIVIDEAHHARRRYTGESKFEATKLYGLAEKLADPNFGGASSCLFLTATPMQLHSFELYSLVEVLDPTMFASFEDFEQHRTALSGLNELVEDFGQWNALKPAQREQVQTEIGQWVGEPKVSDLITTAEGRGEIQDRLLAMHRLSNVMVRNRKAVVGDFQPRVATTWEVELRPEERVAYDAVTEYVRTGYNRASLEQNPAIGFLMTTFQKLLSSSTRALTSTMIKRIEKLEREATPPAVTGGLEDETIEEHEISAALDPILGVGAYEATSEECRELEGLVGLLDAIEIDSKAEVLRDRLTAEIAKADPDAKVLIFTQYRNTQEYLRELLEHDPWTVHLFHGGLNPKAKDAAVEAFRESSGPQLLISTEAGGEGRNFQFCHMMVNYDLPWNPMKVEQRIGRIDRIGQKHPVKIFNLSTRDTVEERIVNVLTERIKLFTETVGGLDPILGDVERDLKDMMLMAGAKQQEKLDAYEQQLEDRVHKARQAEEKRRDFIMDMRSYRQDEVQAVLDRRPEMTNEDLRQFMVGSLAELGCKMWPDPTMDGVLNLRFSDQFEMLFPSYIKEGLTRRVAFEPSVALDHEAAEFYAFGHEVVDGLVDRARVKGYAGRASVRRVLSSEIPATRGWFFLYALELDGVIGRRELLPVFVDLDGASQPEIAEQLLSRALSDKREDLGVTELPERDAEFDAAAGLAEKGALERLLARRGALADENEKRLEAERNKLERFYEYKQVAAAEKVERVRTTFERLSTSQDPDVQRILPVWAKNLENAKHVVEHLAGEREHRLAALHGREAVSARHTLVAASYVEVWPDPGELEGIAEDKVLRWKLRQLCEPSTPDEIKAVAGKALARAKQLEQLSRRHSFNPETAVTCLREMIALGKRRTQIGASGRFLLRGAIEYFLLVDDEIHDLNDPGGFDDDLVVIRSVAEWISDQDEAG